MKDSSTDIQFFSKVTRILSSTFQSLHHLCEKQLQVKIPNQQIHHHDSQSENSSVSSQPEQSNSMQKTPQKNKLIQKPQKSQKKKKIPKWKIQGKPKPPLNSFMLFLQDSKSQIMSMRPQLTSAQVSSYASDLWAALGSEDKAKYQNQFIEQKKKYTKILQEYNKERRIQEQSETVKKCSKNKSSKKTKKQESKNKQCKKFQQSEEEDNSIQI